MRKPERVWSVERIREKEKEREHETGRLRKKGIGGVQEQEGERMR